MIDSCAIAVISFDLVRSSVSVAMQEDYIIVFSGEGKRRVEKGEDPSAEVPWRGGGRAYRP